jgi:hypothetical protein
MKRISSIISLLFVAGTALGQQVSLTANPANETVVGTTVALSASVRVGGPATQLPGAPTYDRNGFRFTFKSQRKWPCAETVTIAENVRATGGQSTLTVVTHASSYPWSGAKAGEYTISVDVTYIRIGRAITKQGTILKPERIGSATMSYKVMPQPGWSGNVKTTFDPPSPATLPASPPLSVNLYVSMYFPEEFKWYRYKNRNCMGCPAGTATQNHVTSATFAMKIPTTGSYIFPIDIDKVVQYPGQSDCTWEQSIQMPHTTPAWYYVNR